MSKTSEMLLKLPLPLLTLESSKIFLFTFYLQQFDEFLKEDFVKNSLIIKISSNDSNLRFENPDEQDAFKADIATFDSGIE